jgi:5-methyltetrahydropteroyltriglutamate--homocysteine methyltransferase
MTAGEFLKTTVVGSYPQPDWLVDKAMLRSQLVPRVRTEALWRVTPALRAEALQDATLLAIRDMETAGIDVITDGEIGRESYSNHFALSLDGIDVDNPATIINRIGRETRVPRVVGPVRHRINVEGESARFLRRNTRRQTKITLPGPFTLAQQTKDEHYHDPEALAMAFAAAVNTEARALQDCGIDVIQLDEPWLRNDPAAARSFALKALERALDGLTVRTALHLCFGYAFLAPGKKPRAYEFLAELADSRLDEISIEAAQPDLDLGVLRELRDKTIVLGVVNLSSPDVEPVETIATRIRAGLVYVSPERLMPAPDCGMKYLSRSQAFGRLKNMVEAAALVRREIAQPLV